MTPILGTIASQISGHLVAPDLGSFFPIRSYVVPATSQTVITFSSIPATYKHLQIRLTAKLSANGYPQLRFNGDTGSNYSYHYIYGNGSSAYSGGSTSTTNIFTTYAGNATNPTVSVIDILDYADTNKYNTTRSLNGQDNNGTGFIWLFSGNWRNTAAVTSITLTTNDLFTQYSSFALYGVM